MYSIRNVFVLTISIGTLKLPITRLKFRKVYSIIFMCLKYCLTSGKMYIEPDQ